MGKKDSDKSTTRECWVAHDRFLYTVVTVPLAKALEMSRKILSGFAGCVRALRECRIH